MSLFMSREKKRPREVVDYTLYIVVPPGLEPRLAEPKSDVLPLHHGTNLNAF